MKMFRKKNYSNKNAFNLSIALFSFLIFFSFTLNVEKGFTNLLAFGQSATGPIDNPNQSIPKERIKDYEALSLENGKPITVANATGNLIILNSWATWCVPCREEMPGLEQLYEEYKDKGLEVIGVSVDSFGMDDRIKLFAERIGVTYPIWHDPNDAFTRTFKAIGVPESYLIDKNGTIYHQWKGQFNPVSANTKALVEDALLKVSPSFASAAELSNTTITANLSSTSSPTTDISTTPSSIGDSNAIGSDITTIGIPIAFAAGLLSFLSPCILPIIPSFVAFITGMSSDELLNKNNKRKEGSPKYDDTSDSLDSSINNKIDTKTASGVEEEFEKHESVHKVTAVKSTTFLRGCLFILGFSLVFVALGASITAIGSAFHEYSRWIEIIGGIMIILFGLNLLGILKIPGAQRDRGYKFDKRPAGHVGSLLIGMGFGAGWTPCIGPILASILTVAAVTTSLYEGVLLLVVYSAGLAIPFIISALAIDKYLVTYKKLSKYMPWIHRISVALLIIMGVLLLTGYLTLFTTSLAGTFPMLG
ncbi:cytochrome c biogenesis protein CcdA [Candidatus Nitrosocosmicus hydrocola]|uniref:redoxin domain-containing protein n=1 Tax=Candidatus Nitrosocosmicus hydrocola TaxID=1826872 RepID=UPI000ACD0D39|nr:cytochrome c biogenesis protein CcdA [Candidatus Nitrosocosmicus hydrocola]